jgi:hypothetical protein
MGHALASLWVMLFGLLLAFPALTPQAAYRLRAATLSSSPPTAAARFEQGTSRELFDLNEPVCLHVHLDEVRESHRYRAIAYRNGVEQWQRESAWLVAQSFDGEESQWWTCDEDEMLPGTQ